MDRAGSLRAGLNLCGVGEHQPAILFRTWTQVDDPLVEPRSLQGPGRHFRDRPQNVGSTQRTETVLRLGADVGITWIQWSIDPEQYERCSEIRLMQRVDMGISRERPPTPQ